MLIGTRNAPVRAEPFSRICRGTLFNTRETVAIEMLASSATPAIVTGLSVERPALGRGRCRAVAMPSLKVNEVRSL